MSMGDKQYAENVASSGGAGEPADSFTEVATGLRDADGNMIFKKTYTGTTSANTNLVDSELSSNTLNFYKVAGYIEVTEGGHKHSMPISGGLNGNFLSGVDLRDDGFYIYTEGHSAFRENCPYYVTLYYTHKPVPRATARKTTTK